MLGFAVDKRQFVATTTAVALLIDAARVPEHRFRTVVGALLLMVGISFLVAR